MKKGLLLIAIMAAVVAVYFLFFVKDEDQPKAPKQQPLVQGKNNDTFNMPFNDMLNAYFEVKDALVDWDTTKANASATKLVELANKVPYDALKADTTVIETAKNLSGSVIAEAMGMLGENTIDGKRHSLYTLSDNLYTLLRAVQYDQQTLYYDKCPMAFDESKDGYWLTNSRKIVNPYLGNKHPKYKGSMVTCGEITDSVGYASH